jgi:hypothetical protein
VTVTDPKIDARLSALEQRQAVDERGSRRSRRSPGDHRRAEEPDAVHEGGMTTRREKHRLLLSQVVVALMVIAVAWYVLASFGLSLRIG